MYNTSRGNKIYIQDLLGIPHGRWNDNIKMGIRGMCENDK